MAAFRIGLEREDHQCQPPRMTVAASCSSPMQPRPRLTFPRWRRTVRVCEPLRMTVRQPTWPPQIRCLEGTSRRANDPLDCWRSAEMHSPEASDSPCLARKISKVSCRGIFVGGGILSIGFPTLSLTPYTHLEGFTWCRCFSPTGREHFCPTPCAPQTFS